MVIHKQPRKRDGLACHARLGILNAMERRIVARYCCLRKGHCTGRILLMLELLLLSYITATKSCPAFLCSYKNRN